MKNICPPKVVARELDGIFLLDKDKGVSSNRALQQVKRLFKAKKAGHTGTLDPLATGMLPICFGRATKFAEFFLDADKSYFVIAQLGQRTETGDAEGQIISTQAVPTLNRDLIESYLQAFRGEQQQIPSMYSALKHQGKPLYEYARAGITVERQPRSIMISEFSLIDFDAATLTLQISCSKGTYIRTLIDDLGEAMGCGAYVSLLRRTRVSSFTKEQMITFTTLDELMQNQGLSKLDEQVLSITAALKHLPALPLAEGVLFQLRSGRKDYQEHALKPGLIRLMNHANQCVAVGEVLSNGCLRAKKWLSVD
jgi:tRNA pseudouridine55 synthase